MATTLQTLITLVRLRTNTENNEFITDAELISYLNTGIDLLDALLTSLPGDYRETSVIFTLMTALDGYNNYPLPSDFKSARNVQRNYGGQFFTIPRFMERERDRFTYDYLRLPSGMIQVRYKIEDNQVTIEPWANSGGTYRLFYTPRFVPLADGYDTIPAYMDRPSWVEYVVLDVCSKVLQKQDLDFTSYLAQKQEIHQHILETSKSRDDAQPTARVDVRGCGGYDLTSRWRY